MPWLRRAVYLRHSWRGGMLVRRHGADHAAGSFSPLLLRKMFDPIGRREESNKLIWRVIPSSLQFRRETPIA
jgi:hypothetical protein